jgi:hypothetical protein
VEDGQFERLYPEIGGEDDDGGGFHCGDITEVTEGIGEGVVDPDR